MEAGLRMVLNVKIPDLSKFVSDALGSQSCWDMLLVIFCELKELRKIFARTVEEGGRLALVDSSMGLHAKKGKKLTADVGLSSGKSKDQSLDLKDSQIL